MFKSYILIFFSLILNLKILNVFAEEKKILIEPTSTNNLIWEFDNSFSEDEPLWIEESRIDYFKTLNKKVHNLNEKSFISIRSIGKGVSINGSFYSDISNYVPNGFVEEPNKIFGISTRGISKTRHCNGKNFSESCIDGVIDFDFKLFNNDNFSIYPKINLQSLTSRGSDFGEGLSLGVKFAKQLYPNWSIAFGGENIVHFDETIDLGRNFYVVASTYLPLNTLKNPSILFLNAGIGSDFYGYKGNGFLFRTNCLGNNTLTAIPDNPDSCSWGPIASIALSLNDRFSIISEWFGYSYGAGFSIRPFKENSLSFSLFATDFIKGFPKYADDSCHKSLCETRFYGSISVHF